MRDKPTTRELPKCPTNGNRGQRKGEEEEGSAVFAIDTWSMSVCSGRLPQTVRDMRASTPLKVIRIVVRRRREYIHIGVVMILLPHDLKKRALERESESK